MAIFATSLLMATPESAGIGRRSPRASLGDNLP
jgi:hypothetical protein